MPESTDPSLVPNPDQGDGLKNPGPIPPASGTTPSEREPAPHEMELIELDDWPSIEAPYRLGAPRRIEDTRATLAYCLVGLLAVVMIGLMILLTSGQIPSTNFAEVAGVLVSPLIGLVGAVAGYYYGKSEKS
jgi:hypothetical protein